MVVWRPSTYPSAAGNAFKSADGFGRLLKRVGVSLPAGVYGMYMTFIWGYVYVVFYATEHYPAQHCPTSQTLCLCAPPDLRAGVGFSLHHRYFPVVLVHMVGIITFAITFACNDGYNISIGTPQPIATPTTLLSVARHCCCSSTRDGRPSYQWGAVPTAEGAVLAQPTTRTVGDALSLA